MAALDVPPPGAGLKTVIDNEPATATSVAGISAVSWFEFTNVVGRFDPLTLTIDDPRNVELDPLTVRLSAPVPAITLAGEILSSDGTGLPVVTVRVTGADKPPPGDGLKTEIDSDPGCAMSADVIAADS